MNLEAGQTFGISAFVEHAPLVRAVTRVAYEKGARYVDVFYMDEYVRKAYVDLAPEETLGVSPEWALERVRSFGDTVRVPDHPRPSRSRRSSPRPTATATRSRGCARSRRSGSRT